jgi:hypothetical protein
MAKARRDDEKDDLDDEDEDDVAEDGDGIARIEPERASAFAKTETTLRTFYKEISLISNKKPDSPINKFKLGLLNEVLEKAAFVLGDEFRPFPEFRTFDEKDMPTASDVVLMVSHYLDGLRALEGRYRPHDYWQVIGDAEIGGESDDE